MMMTCTYKVLRYITLAAVTSVCLIILVLQFEDEYTAERYTTFLQQLQPAKLHDINVSNFTVTKLKPEERLYSLCRHVDTINRHRMTSLKFSKMKLLYNNNEGNITVTIETFDMRNERKIVGDDVIVVWASQVDGDGRVSGHVIDHKNGSYTANIKVFWTGMTKVRAKLASSLENICLRIKALTKYGNTVFAMQNAWGIRGTYRTNLIKELTTCGANNIIFGYKKVCNFTSLNGGMSWYCGKPKHKTIKCSDIESFGTGPFYNGMVPQKEKIQNNGHGFFKHALSLDIQTFRKEIRKYECSERPPLLSWNDTEPSGYWLNNKWNFVNCISNIKYNDPFYARCLKNKNLLLIGDSTVRQYAEYFIENVLGLGHVNMRDALGANGQYHANNLYKNHGINVMYLKHEMPFHNPNFPAKGIVSVPQILHSLENNSFRNGSLIVIINYNSHFSAYPPSKFRERIRHLVTAIESFVTRNPNTKIFFKGPHLTIDDTRWFDPKMSQLYKKIIYEEFIKLTNHVVYLDVWSITVTHNSDYLHPIGDAFSSQIHQLMSYIC